MDVRLGLIGVFFFGVSGFFLYTSLHTIIHKEYLLSSDVFVGFLVFLLLGFGLWLIISSGRIEMKQEN